jgi:leader peptidase (prepilin peptidase) / N-methyltransferase
MVAFWAPLIAAPFIGSFLGVLIRRLPLEQPVLWDRSRCESCGTTLGWRDLVPLLSYWAARGRCRHCGAPIGVFHPAVELAACLIALSACVVTSDPAACWIGCALGWTLLALAWIDAEHFYLPDVLTLPLLLAGLAATWWLQPDALADHALAAAVSYGGLRLLGWSYRVLRGQEGLGQGDAKLLAAAGAWLGLLALPWVLLTAALLGLATAVPGLVRGAQASTLRVPFGPPLALAIWALWLA